ncbi:MAG: hypothetical protein H6900_04365 [Rhodobacter sp.]|uniref:hypothetical protein n=1 Tax=Pararhodobacter sp. TaxID=2127056 RepID=UPI001D3F7E16|nr:hypothetical protein [Pararhodobacter sp.]MCB1344074.1 hypothetical protein [Paracoccaceae bacterium]MCC0072507.1 hypothetical protein [Rhodobacter sp.]HPD94231.1 hypothetical protein [Pararhodobacter sp.]
MFRLALILAMLAQPAAAQSLASRFTGIWRGDGIETGGTRWAMTLFLRPDGAVVDYPDFPCSAYWTLGSESDGRLFATEHLVAGRTLCADDLRVMIRSDGRQGLLIEWTYPDGSVSAVAQLARQ